MPAVATAAVTMTPAMIRRRMAPPWSGVSRVLPPRSSAAAMIDLRADRYGFVKQPALVRRAMRDSGAQVSSQRRGHLGEDLDRFVHHVPPRELEVEPAGPLAAVPLHLVPS